MTTITPFAAGAYLTTRNASNLTALKNQLNDLSNQVSSGKVATTYGGLGAGRSTALNAQAMLSALTGYASGIGAAQTRTDLAVTSLTQVATLGTTARDTLNNGLQSAAATTVSGRATAMADLQTALDTLNQSAAGNYLFGGGNATTPPVADVGLIINGTTNQDGSKKLGLQGYIAEQVKADLGSGMGRLGVTQPTSNAVTVSEPNDATRGTFGFTLSGATSSTPSVPTAIAATSVAGTTSTQGQVSFTVNSQPAVGDSITVTLQMNDKDKTTTTLTLTAVSGTSDPSVTGTGATFAIGADKDATADNLNTALKGVLSMAAQTTLTASSTATAAENFFSGSASAGVYPLHIDTSSGLPAYVAGTKDNTVLWYQGEDSQTPAIDTQSVQISAGASIGTGARANDGSIQKVLAGLATMAYALPATTAGDVNTAYQAVVDRAGGLLTSAYTSPSVQDTVTQLSLASARLKNASSTNAATQNTVQNTLDGIEQAPTEEVVAKLLDVQNRLQASYQITATLSKLSLVNYIS
ncbi:flagellin [Methylobacterium sp. E-005]|uniref:flagellin n=1 Tax=Methylobacterium sp. E-005 TaxID=2836549 RepID=UPI001FBA19E5|nr:flagellin [Methylobacterium sp. E-005]MCJ2089361.1 flagellin [Methylobacterium sp. E-005]